MSTRSDKQEKHNLISARREYRSILAQQVIQNIHTTSKAARIACCSTRTMRRAIAKARTVEVKLHKEHNTVTLPNPP